VRDLATSKGFYELALAPLGYSLLLEYPGVWGFGAEQKPDFWLDERGEPGAPWPRPIYHQHYYGAYVLDPEGNNVEAVCHQPG
jgi:hypothetical protein